MTFRDVLQKAKEHGFTHYWDGGTIETPIDEVLEWGGLNKEGYKFRNMGHGTTDIVRGKNNEHIGTVG